MPKVKFNIKTNLRGTVYEAGDECVLSEKDIKMFSGEDAGKMPHLIRVTKGEDNAKKNDEVGRS
tara:strand:+ start:1620 stop:1811 length:192 start_codon:yes stop_codon:yes gene_type:complete